MRINGLNGAYTLAGGMNMTQAKGSSMDDMLGGSKKTALIAWVQKVR